MDLIIRKKFWFAIGLVALIALLVVLFGWLPRRRGNDREFGKLEDKAADLEKHKKEGVKNELWIEQEKGLAQDAQKQLGRVRQVLAEYDTGLEQWFKENPDALTEARPQPGMWIIVHDQMVAELRKELQESVDRMGSNALKFRQFPFIWPLPAEMYREEKNYWIQKAVVETIAELNKGQKIVPVFHSFVFTAAPDRNMQSSHGKEFRCISFCLRVSMEDRYVPRLLEQLLKAPLAFEITSLTVARGRQDQIRERVRIGSASGIDFIPREGLITPEMDEMQDEIDRMERREGYLEGGEELFDLFGREEPTVPVGPSKKGVKRLSDTLVSVAVYGYVPDYVQPAEKGPTTGSSGATGAQEAVGPS